MDSERPFAGILLGQPALTRQLRLGVFTALDQRIATRSTSRPWISARAPPTCDTISDSPDAPASSSPTTPWSPFTVFAAASPALIAAADGKEIVDDACARKARAELTRD